MSRGEEDDVAAYLEATRKQIKEAKKHGLVYTLSEIATTPDMERVHGREKLSQRISILMTAYEVGGCLGRWVGVPHER